MLETFKPFSKSVKNAKIAAMDATHARKEALKEMESIDRLRRMIRECIKTKSENAARNQSIEELLRIEAIKEVASISFEKDSMEIYTTPIVATDPSNKKRYKMGCYRITLPPSVFKGKINIGVTNLTHPIQSMHHPHVRGDSICWGNIGETLITLFQEKRLAMAIGMIIAFLQTCNPDDPWGLDIRKWPLVEEKNPSTPTP